MESLPCLFLTMLVFMHTCNEIGGWGCKPKVPRPGIRVPSSTSSRYRVSRTRRVTCVTCVSCRACDVARDRSIGRVRSEGPEIVLWLRRTRRVFLLCSALLSSAPARVSRVPRTWACYFTCFLHTSNVILTIPGEHGENIDPLC